MNDAETPVVLVTGASGGIGRAICRSLSDAGYAIVAHYNSRKAEAESLRDDIRATGGWCATAKADLASGDGARVLAESTISAIRTSSAMYLHGLVNNAAKLSGPSLKEITAANFDSMLAINTRAPLLLISELLHEFATGASIVNISSASAHLSSPGNPVYAMSKSAVESMTRSLAESIAPFGHRVNAVVPGFTDNGHPAFRDERALAYMSAFSVLGGVASPGTVASAVRFLLSEESGRTTGSVLDVSGGTTIRPRGSAVGRIADLADRAAADS